MLFMNHWALKLVHNAVCHSHLYPVYVVLHGENDIFELDLLATREKHPKRAWWGTGPSNHS